MSLVNKIGYYDVTKKDGQIVKIGGFIELMLDHYDKRFFNIPAPLVDEDANYRDSCGVYFVYDMEDTNKHRLGNDLIYITNDDEDYKIGSLDEDEMNDVKYWLLTYALTDVGLYSHPVSELNKEDFEAEYYVKTVEIE